MLPPHPSLSRFDWQAIRVFFFLLWMFVGYYRRPLVSSYFPLKMSLNMHLCTIHLKKQDDVSV